MKLSACFRILPFLWVFFLVHPIYAAKSESSTTTTYTYTYHSSAVGCPTPLATSGVYTIPVTTKSSAAAQFTGYVKPVGSVIPQVVGLDNKGNSITLKLQNSSRIEYYQPGGQSTVIDNNGITLFDANCSKSLLLPIKNLAAVLNSRASSTAPKRSLPFATVDVLAPRAYTDLPVAVTYLDQCGKPIDGHTAYVECEVTNPYIGFDSGVKKTALTSAGQGVYTGSCSYPDTAAAVEKCKKTERDILDYFSIGFQGQLTNIPTDLTVASALVGKSFIPKAVKTFATNVFRVSGAATALFALAIYQGFVAAHGDDFVANHLCSAAGTVHISVGSNLDIQGAYVQINTQTALPFTAVTATRTASLAAKTCTTTTTSSTSTPSYLPYQEIGADAVCDVSGSSSVVAYNSGYIYCYNCWNDTQSATYHVLCSACTEYCCFAATQDEFDTLEQQSDYYIIDDGVACESGGFGSNDACKNNNVITQADCATDSDSKTGPNYGFFNGNALNKRRRL